MLALLGLPRTPLRHHPSDLQLTLVHAAHGLHFNTMHNNAGLWASQGVSFQHGSVYSCWVTLVKSPSLSGSQVSPLTNEGMPPTVSKFFFSSNATES